MQNPSFSPSAAGQVAPAQGNYEIVGRIATGGMAEIYLARAEGIPGVSEVVLKRLMPELQTDHEFVQMFHDEANIAAKLRHPGIVRIFELGSLDGSLFIAMELLRGANLRDILQRLHKLNRPMPIPEAAMIAMAVLEALDYAHRFTDPQGHQLNVVHRDVSPQNIIVTYEGGVKLVDFGVAKAEGRLHQTRAGLIKGKFAYMSPEQVSGGHIDGRSDLFAVAEVFYELLLKQHPFYANSDMEVLRKILDIDPVHPCELDRSFPPELADILMRAMRKQPGDRYPSAGHMMHALSLFVQRHPPTSAGHPVAAFMHSMFARRIEKERRARGANDDDLLVASLVSGDGESADLAPITGNGPVVSSGPAAGPVVSQPGSAAHDPAETPRFMAHSGYHSSPRMRYRGEEETLFDVRTTSSDLSDDDNPDQTRPLSSDDLAHIRETAAKEYSSGVTVTTRDLSPEPTKSASPQILPPAPQPRRGPKTGPKTGPKPPRGSVPPGPVEFAAGSNDLAATQKLPTPTSDRIGLAFFFVGLITLLAAVGYAVYLYLDLGGVTLRSEPPGADVWINGRYTGQITPGRLRKLSSEGERTILFRLDGYQDCVQLLADGESPSELSCTLQAQ